MTYFTTWEEFAKAAERLYMTDPIRVRLVLTNLSSVNGKHLKQSHSLCQLELDYKVYYFFTMNVTVHNILHSYDSRSLKFPLIARLITFSVSFVSVPLCHEVQAL
jgi:hypothetical protein